jgi:RNA polymerase sigma factor (sigma-70 family)
MNTHLTRDLPCRLQKIIIFTKNVTDRYFLLSNTIMAYTGDIDVIEDILKGNVQAFETIVKKYQSMIFTLVIRLVNHREAAEEVAQDVFVKAYKSLHTFRRESNFKTWIYRIAYNESVNYLRAHQKNIKTTDLSDQEMGNIRDVQIEGNHADLAQIISESIMTLPEIDRIIITLYYYEDLPIKEIVKATGLTESNIKARLFRSRQKLYDEISALQKIHDYVPQAR